MIEIGKTNNLVISKKVDFGIYLTDDECSEEILLPKKYIPNDVNIGDRIDAFVHLDSEDRIIATTEKPIAEIGEVAHLKVNDLSSFGAFLDWGLAKDLLVPFKEQRTPMQKDKSYSVFIFIDASGRISASSKLSRYLIEENNGDFDEDDKVKLHIASRSPIGYKAVINGTHLGLIHNSELLQPIKLGLKANGYIRKIRDDGRIDLSLQKRGVDVVNNLADDIIAHIANENNIKLNDKASPQEIYDIFKVSKSNYKKAVGKLLSEQKIIIEANIISLIK